VTEDDEPMATDYELAGLLGLGDVAHFEPGRYRRERMTAKRRLRVPIGIAANGTPLELDIKEAAQEGMGPHGLCVGATGSGKVGAPPHARARLAMTHSPEHLNLVLVDFKGGATFPGCSTSCRTSRR
jgi:S-DNA-T family DNA segregation ATPase FtsK/SpoIIIE